MIIETYEIVASTEDMYELEDSEASEDISDQLSDLETVDDEIGYKLKHL
jgi:hypothetical protein